MSGSKITFIELLSKEVSPDVDICIPIIQRDYAHGREDSKASDVRKLLLKNIIDVLDPKTTGRSIDLNFVYGTIKGKTFYAVDGQQRLTTLFLTAWYLAVTSEDPDCLDHFKDLNVFTYQTRNSSTEFFRALKEPNDKLLTIVRDKENTESLKDRLKNSIWFRANWSNDPTVQSALVVLNDLHKQMKSEAYDNNVRREMYENLNAKKRSDNDEEDAERRIYFQLEIEQESENAETIAAQTYLRMNARGKPLTDFENLKAMLDKIGDELDPNIKLTQKYDNDLVNALYNECSQTADLDTKTSYINSRSFNMFINVFNMCRLLAGLAPLPSENFVSEIHESSRSSDFDQDFYSFYSAYLTILVKLIDFYCALKTHKINAGETVEKAFKNMFSRPILDSMLLTEISPVVLCTYYNDNVATANDANALVSICWQMDNVRKNLSIDIKAVDELAERSTDKAKGISCIFEYFKQFTSFGQELKDLCDDHHINKCIMKEQWLKAKIIRENSLADSYFAELENRSQNNELIRRRTQYLLYIAGYWKNYAQGDIDKLKDYCEIAKSYYLNNDIEWKKLWAAVNYYDNGMKSAADIDLSCDDHIPWENKFYVWDSDEPDEMPGADQTKYLNNIKKAYDNKAALENEIKNIALPTADNCWLKYAIQYSIFDYKLCNENNTVKVDSDKKPFDMYVVMRKEKAAFGLNSALYVSDVRRCTFPPDPNTYSRTNQHVTLNLYKQLDYTPVDNVGNPLTPKSGECLHLLPSEADIQNQKFVLTVFERTGNYKYTKHEYDLHEAWFDMVKNTPLFDDVKVEEGNALWNELKTWRTTRNSSTTINELVNLGWQTFDNNGKTILNVTFSTSKLTNKCTPQHDVNYSL